MSQPKDETKRARWWAALQCAGGLTPTDRRNLLVFIAWFIVWFFSFGIVSRVLRAGIDLDTRLAWGLALAPNLFAMLAVGRYLRFLRHADELVRRIHLDALAIGLATGLVFVIGWGVLELAGARELPIDYAAQPMVFGWAIGLVWSSWKYR